MRQCPCNSPTRQIGLAIPPERVLAISSSNGQGNGQEAAYLHHLSTAPPLELPLCLPIPADSPKPGSPYTFLHSSSGSTTAVPHHSPRGPLGGFADPPSSMLRYEMHEIAFQKRLRARRPILPNKLRDGSMAGW